MLLDKMTVNLKKFMKILETETFNRLTFGRMKVQDNDNQKNAI